MIERSFDEMIGYFNRRVSEMDIDREYKIELFAMATALGYRHEKSTQHWIPCSKRAPSELQECWLTGIDGMVYQGTFTRRHGERRDSGFICNGFQFAFLNAVVAWMPYEAPKAYKGEEP